MQPGEWSKSGSWLDFEGVNLFTVSLGAGLPVLVLHGFPTASYDFSRIAPALAEHYRLILFDYPGFGFSDKPRQYPYSLFRYADAAEAVAHHFGLSELFLLAHDIGDSVALELLRRGTLKVKNLILLNGSVYSIPLDDPGMLLIQRTFLHPIGGPGISALRLMRKGVFARTFRKLFYAGLPEEDLNAFWSLMKNNNGVGIYHRLIQYMRERWEHQFAWLETLKAHPVPLTLLWGQDDPVATPEVADEIVIRRPDAQDIRLRRVGHYPHWEAPDAVIQSVLRSFG